LASTNALSAFGASRSASQETITPLAKGLRERKKLKTRESIQREAMRLIGKQGYEQTTVEQIAAAVEISPSTFFNYFPSKEDVVLYDAYDPVIVELMGERPAGEPLSVSMRNVLEKMGGIFERDREIILARGRLWFEVPALRAIVGTAGAGAGPHERGHRTAFRTGPRRF
jgi:AcrR family transcriptional regulator